MQILNVTDIILSFNKNIPIYFLHNDVNNFEIVKWNSSTLRDRYVADCYQFILKGKTIIPVEYEEIINISGEKFLLTTSNVDISALANEYKLLGKDDGSLLYISE